MQTNQLYPCVIPSAHMITDSTFSQNNSQTPIYYQPTSHSLMMSPVPNQRLFDGAKQNQHSKQWSSGLCNCFSDIGECALAFFFPLCYEIRLFNMADENCCSCVFGGLVPLRTKIRTKYNIEGSICSDFCTVLWCGFCSTVQMSIELKKNRSY